MSDIELLTKAIAEQWPQDTIRPGLVVAWLGNEWYMSVVRYKSHTEKDVVTWIKAWDFEYCVTQLSKQFLIKIQPPNNSIQKLAKRVGLGEPARHTSPRVNNEHR